MGFDPEQTGHMSLWQFNSCFDGWCAAHGGSSAMDQKTFDDLSSMLDREMEKEAEERMRLH